MRKSLLLSLGVLLSVPAYGAVTQEAAEQIDMMYFFDAKTPEEAARKARIVEAGWEMPEDMRIRIPGMDPTDAEVIEVFLNDLVNANNGNVWLPFWDVEASADGPPIMLRRIYNSRDPDPASEFGHRWSWGFGNRLRKQGDVLTIRDADGAVMTFKQTPGSKNWVATMAAHTVIEKDGGYLRTMPSDSLAERYDRDGFLIERIDAQGRKARVKRDAKGRPTGLVANNGRTIDFTLDGRNRIVQAKNQAGQVAKFTYDGDRLVTSEKNGLLTKYAYDAESRLTAVEFPFGEKLAIRYVESGFVSEVSIGRRVLRARYTIDASNPAIHGSQITIDGETTKYEYDENTGNTRTIHPSGNVELEKLDPTCGCLAETDHAGQKTAYSYDAMGRLVRVKSGLDEIRWEYGPKAAKHQVVFSGSQKILDIRYNEFGQPLIIASEGNPVVEYAYESGRMKQIKTAGEVMRHFRWSPQGDLIAYSDGKVALEASHDSAGYVKELRKTDRVRLEFKPRSDHIIPTVRMTMNWNGKLRQSVLAKEELRMIFNDSVDLVPGKQKGSLDDIPGVKYAQHGFFVLPPPSPEVSAEIEAARQWIIQQYERFANPPGGTPCTRLDFAQCRLRKFTACILPALVGLIPFVGNIGINFDVGPDGKGSLGNDWVDIFGKGDPMTGAEQASGLITDLAEKREEALNAPRPNRQQWLLDNGYGPGVPKKPGNRKFDSFIRAWKANQKKILDSKIYKAVRVIKGIATPLKVVWLANDIRKCVKFTDGDNSDSFISDPAEQCP